MWIRLLAVLLVSVTLANGQIYDRLYSDLLSGYKKDTIPLRSRNDTVRVTFSLMLIQMNSLNEESGDAELDIWLSSKWVDPRLRWSPQDYYDISIIRVPYDKIWAPDIVLYNGRTDISDQGLNAVIVSDGSITKIPQTTVKTKCRFGGDDKATCSLKFGSWTYDGRMIDLTLQGTGIDLTEYIANGRWKLVSATAKRNVVHYSCCPEPYIDVSYTLTFRKKSWWPF